VQLPYENFKYIVLQQLTISQGVAVVKKMTVTVMMAVM
jgi:hypothetical protein